MFTTLDQITKKYKLTFDESSIQYENIILDIFNNNNSKYECEDDTDDCETKNNYINDQNILNILSLYYRYVRNNYYKMEKYLKMAIVRGNYKAMYYLGNYHHDISKNYGEMEKYLKMAIDKGNTNAMNNLGYYHHNITKNYNKMDEYYKMAIDKGNTNAMTNLGNYHNNITKNYNKMEKYFKMAISKGNTNAMNNLGNYHQNITKNYDEMEKYFKMAIDKGNFIAMNNLGCYHQNITKNYDEMIYYFSMYVKYTDDINIIIVNDINYNLDIYCNIEPKYRYRYKLKLKHTVDIKLYEEYKNQHTLKLISNSLDVDNARDLNTCSVCMDDNPMELISWTCHVSHIVCNKCYPRIIRSKKCHICRKYI